jgi:hypothetical protein
MWCSKRRHRDFVIEQYPAMSSDIDDYTHIDVRSRFVYTVLFVTTTRLVVAHRREHNSGRAHTAGRGPD